MRLRCAILDDFQRVAMDMAEWSALADRVEIRPLHRHFADPDELVAAISDCEIVVAMRERTRFSAALFARLPQLKLLVTTGMRNAAIDLSAAQAHGVVVCGTAGAPESTAELTWALLLGLARQIVPENQALRTGGPWQSTVGMDLNGRRLGLVGLGRIGSRVARVGAAFGMDVIAWSQNLTQERADAVSARLASNLAEVLKDSDFVSIHLVLSERTRGLIGAAELRHMRPTAYLINTARAGIVDQAALGEALRTGVIAGAGLDVFETEPLPTDHIFRSLPNVLATPHLGYVTQGNYRPYFRDAVEDIASFLAGAPVRRLC